MFETIRTISNTEVGLTYLVSQHYEDTILKRGMEALREEIKEKPGHSFLVKLGEIWSNFYQNILPTLLSLFYCIPTHGNSVKQITLLSFRNMVLLQLKIDEALSANVMCASAGKIQCPISRQNPQKTLVHESILSEKVRQQLEISIK